LALKTEAKKAGITSAHIWVRHMRIAERRILRSALPVLRYLVGVCGCWAEPPLQVGTFLVLHAQDSPWKDCSGAQATVLA